MWSLVSIVSALISLSRELLFGRVNRINPFLPTLPLVMVLYHAIGTLTKTTDRGGGNKRPLSCKRCWRPHAEHIYSCLVAQDTVHIAK